jgi:hypothetical protein|tara:strand:+ start:377 stop:553 length:177 start_codon:yes stop_codon:yes gene_type:complete
MGNLMTEYLIKTSRGVAICRVEAGSGDAAVKRARDAGYNVRTGCTIQAIGGGKTHTII